MKRHALPDHAITNARTLRRAATPAEQKLWRALKESFPHLKFRRQVPMGPYIADFLCHAAHLIIEVDGGQHAAQEDYDQVRTDFLAHEGYRLLRFWNNEVSDTLDNVIARIAEALGESDG